MSKSRCYDEGMAKGRGYQQFCPMAAALDVVGDRWALLIVRELVLGPRRFGELAQGLPGIGTDILTARLRSMEQADVLRRTGQGRQQRYELSDRGQALRPVLVELGRWGAGRLGLPSSPDVVSARVGLTALVLDPPAVEEELSGVYEISSGGESVSLVVDHGTIAVAPPGTQPASPASAFIELGQSGLLGLLVGTHAQQLVRRGDVMVQGDRQRASRLLNTLAGPRVLEQLGRG